MDALRYVFGLIMVITVPITLGVWLLIHPFARAWRRIGPAGTYAALTLPSGALGVWLWSTRRTLLGAELGTHPVLVGLGIAAFASAVAVARLRQRQLTTRILTGIPELSRDPGRLLTEGVYAKTRVLELQRPCGRGAECKGLDGRLTGGRD